MNNEDEMLLEELFEVKNLSKGSEKLYRYSINKYLDFHGESLTDLIREADEDEDNNIRMKRRRIKRRLTTFNHYLLEENISPRTRTNILVNVKAVYRYYEIETPVIPLASAKSTETIKDIPSRCDIREALENVTNPKVKAVVLMMCSSGCASREVLNLTIQDYVDATSEYHDEDSIGRVVSHLRGRRDVIPTWHIHRQKTGQQYYTFCTPEATRWINNYLDKRIEREVLCPDSQLFKYSSDGVGAMYRRLNQYVGNRWVGNRRFFHSHAMRKFFATTLINADMDSMTIDFLSGRKISATHEAYFKADPRKLKVKYQRVIDKLTILEDVRVHDVSTRERDELERLRKNQPFLEERVKKLEELFNLL